MTTPVSASPRAAFTSGSLSIASIEAAPLTVALKHPFAIANAPALTCVQNAAVRLQLSNRVVGFGEVPVLPGVTSVATQAEALERIRVGAGLLVGQEAQEWRKLADFLARSELACCPATRAGLEMALVDALARTLNVPLAKLFGGQSSSVVTDITIPICDPSLAKQLACRYQREGFFTIKTKVGKDPVEDVERLMAIRSGFPGCRLIIDANEGFDADEALWFLSELKDVHIVPDVFEQPVPRGDLQGLKRVKNKGGVVVVADESCSSAKDVKWIAEEGLAHGVNIKLAKMGVSEAIQAACLAVRHGLRLMMGGMVESRVGMTFSCHFAAGLGGFAWHDLDTGFLLAEDARVSGGYVAEGSRLNVAHVTKGSGTAFAFD